MPDISGYKNDFKRAYIAFLKATVFCKGAL